jgi:hypothetical protein
MLSNFGFRAAHCIGTLDFIEEQFREAATDDAKDIGWVRDYLKRHVETYYLSLAKDMGLNAATSQAEYVLRQLTDDAYGFKDATTLKFQTQELRRHLFTESREIVCECLGKEKAKYHNATFGPVVEMAFPSASDEIKEASTCYALGRSTAAVFHLMRAAERGLRALAVAVNALPTSPTAKPIELENWDPIIGRIGDASATFIQECENKKLHIEKANAKAFFNATLADYYAFKDAIRNILMHDRSGGTYDEFQALSARNRVEECFNRMAKKLSEDAPPGSLLDAARFATFP